MNIYIGNSRLNGNGKTVEKKTCKDVSLVDYFLLSSDVFSAIKYFDILDYNPLFSDVHCGLSVNKNTTTQDIGQGSNPIHIKWNAAKQSEFAESNFHNETAFGELDYIFNEQCEGNQAKEIVNRVVNKIIDFKKEFDTIWRAGLWQKLINSNIHGKIFKIIFSFYDNFKSCVKSGHTFSDFFHLRYWCKTGRKFIPFLFAIYLNDLEEFLTEHCKTGLDTLNSLSVENLNVYMKLFLLLYADDTVIFAESQQELQQILKLFEHYCNIWKLKVNISKTKIVVFSKKKSNQNFSYEMFGEKLSQQDDYN